MAVGRGLALLLGENGLHFEKRREEFVRVLDGAEGQHSGGVDLVQDGDFAVETGVAGERVLFEVADLRLDILGAAPDGADGGHGVHVCAVHELDGCVLGLHALQLKRVHPGEVVRAVREQLGCGLLVAGVDVGKQAGVDAADPGAGVTEGVQRGDIAPLRKQSAVAGRHVLDELRHLHGEVELVGDLGVAFLQLQKMLLKLLVAEDRILVVGGVVDDPASELRGSGTDTETPITRTKTRAFLFIELPSFLSCLQRSEGIL